MLLSFFAFLLLFLIVRGHAVPRSGRMYDALSLVEPPQQVIRPSGDSFSASELYQPQQRPKSRQMDLAEQPQSVSEIIRSKRWKLQQIVPPATSQAVVRASRSMTPFVDRYGTELHEEELEVNRQLEQQDDVGDGDDGKDQTALQVRQSRALNAAQEEDDSISGALARAARGTDIEDYLWKYVIDSDISASLEDDDDDDDDDDTNPEARYKKKKHLKHKYKKFLLPLLLAYKLKFMMTFPALIGGLALLVKAAGLAGFFFALFASVVSLQKSH